MWNQNHQNKHTNIVPVIYPISYSAENNQEVTASAETSLNWYDRLFLDFIETRIEHLSNISNAFQKAISKIS